MYLLRVAIGLCLVLCHAVAAPAGEKELMTLAFYTPGIRDVPQADVRITLQLWADEIARAYSIVAQAKLYDDMATLRKDAITGTAMLVIAPGMEMAETFSRDELAEGFVGLRAGTDEGLALIVRSDEPIRSFAGLSGKHVLKLANDHLSDVFLELHCHADFKSACRDNFVLSDEKVEAHAIHKVFFGQADAALVKLSALQAAVELNPQVGTRVRTVLEWRTKALAFGMMTRHASHHMHQIVVLAAKDAANTVRGRQILQLFKTDYMEEASPDDLQPYWRLARDYRKLMHTPTARRK